MKGWRRGRNDDYTRSVGYGMAGLECTVRHFAYGYSARGTMSGFSILLYIVLERSVVSTAKRTRLDLT